MPGCCVAAHGKATTARRRRGERRQSQAGKLALIVMDGAPYRAIEGGKRELSAGYACDPTGSRVGRMALPG